MCLNHILLIQDHFMYLLSCFISIFRIWIFTGYWLLLLHQLMLVFWLRSIFQANWRMWIIDGMMSVTWLDEERRDSEDSCLGDGGAGGGVGVWHDWVSVLLPPLKRESFSEWWWFWFANNNLFLILTGFNKKGACGSQHILWIVFIPLWSIIRSILFFKCINGCGLNLLRKNWNVFVQRIYICQRWTVWSAAGLLANRWIYWGLIVDVLWNLLTIVKEIKMSFVYVFKLSEHLIS